MKRAELSLRYWVKGKKPGDENGIEVDSKTLEAMAGKLTLECECWTRIKVPSRDFVEFVPPEGWVKVLPLSLRGNGDRGYWVELVGERGEDICSLTKRYNLPYDGSEIGVFKPELDRD